MCLPLRLPLLFLGYFAGVWCILPSHPTLGGVFWGWVPPPPPTSSGVIWGLNFLLFQQQPGGVSGNYRGEHPPPGSPTGAFGLNSPIFSCSMHSPPSTIITRSPQTGDPKKERRSAAMGSSSFIGLQVNPSGKKKERRTAGRTDRRKERRNVGGCSWVSSAKPGAGSVSLDIKDAAGRVTCGVWGPRDVPRPGWVPQRDPGSSSRAGGGGSARQTLP